MLISIEELVQKYALTIKGILHVGAHECEEKTVYDAIGVKNVLWVDANAPLVEKMKQKYPSEKIVCAAISDTDNQVVDFIVTNNGQSSSILELEEHKIQHPGIHEIARYKVRTRTIRTLFAENHLDIKSFNFLNCDTQGAELMVMKGMGSSLLQFDYLYLEVNTKHLYKNCPLLNEIEEYVKQFGFMRKELKMTEHYWGDIFMMRTRPPAPVITELFSNMQYTSTLENAILQSSRTEEYIAECVANQVLHTSEEKQIELVHRLAASKITAPFSDLFLCTQHLSVAKVVFEQGSFSSEESEEILAVLKAESTEGLNSAKLALFG